jgi:hypothetical protein
MLLSCAVLLALRCAGAVADDLPLRKAGLWELKIIRDGSEVSMARTFHCTDAAVDRRMSTSVLIRADNSCSQRGVQKTATGYIIDSICDNHGKAASSHIEITGDFNSAYVMRDDSAAHDVVEAKWIGDCGKNLEAGDVVLLNGRMKTSIKELDQMAERSRAIKGLLTDPAPKK